MVCATTGMGPRRRHIPPKSTPESDYYFIPTTDLHGSSAMRLDVAKKCWRKSFPSMTAGFGTGWPLIFRECSWKTIRKAQKSNKHQAEWTWVDIKKRNSLSPLNFCVALMLLLYVPWQDFLGVNGCKPVGCAASYVLRQWVALLEFFVEMLKGFCGNLLK